MTNGEVEGRVREVVAQSVRMEPGAIGFQVPFEDLGLDSVGALLLIERLEETFDITIPEADALHLTTIESVAGYVARSRASAGARR